MVQDKEIQMYRYAYTVKAVELTIDKTTYAFEDGTCVYLFIRHDYKNRRFPIMMMGLEMDMEKIQLFYQNKDSVKLKLDIVEQQFGENDTLVNTALYLRKTFTCIAARDQSSYTTAPDNTSKEIIDTMQTVQNFEMYLLDMDMVNIFAKEISMIIDTGSKSALLQMIFSSRDIQPGVVIATPPMNDKTLNSVTIPLGDMVKNIDLLNTTYGLYDSYPVIYYDNQYIYCINMIDPNIVIQDAKEYGNVMLLLLNQTLPEHNITGSADDVETQTHYINLTELPTIVDTSDKDTNTKFSTLLTVNKDGAVSQKTVSDQATKALFTRSYNELTEDQIKNEMIRGHMVMITTTSCGVSFLRPYKIFTFDVDTSYSDKGLTGHTYRLMQWSIMIDRDSPSKYIHTVSMILQRPDHD